MNRSAAISIIASRLGNRSGLDTAITTELQLAQTKLEARATLPWFLIKAAADFATEAHEATLAVPTDFIRELDEADGMWCGTKFISKDEYDYLSQKFSLASEGLPQAYSLVGDSFYFFPTPAKVYPLKLFYYAADAVLDTDVENKWLKYIPEILICKAGKEIAKFLRDPNAVALFDQGFREADAELIAQNAARKFAASNMLMGG